MSVSGISALPKVDLHVHGEAFGWTLAVLARRRGYAAHDQGPLIAEAQSRLPTGLARLGFLDAGLGRDWPEGELAPGDLVGMDDQPDHVESRYEALMEASARQSALHIEVRVGGDAVFAPHFLPSFRAAESRVRSRHPGFGAAPLLAWRVGPDLSHMEARVRRTIEAADQGLSGVDLYPSDEPDAEEVTILRRWACQAERAGLGITCHAGEFSARNLRLALDLPSVTRLGHAVHAPEVPGMLEELRRHGITVEVQLTSNLLLGAVTSLAAHPIHRFLDAGVAVTLGSDDPLRLGTNINREYQVAASLGFSASDLRTFTCNGIDAAFISQQRKAALRAVVEGSPPGLIGRSPAETPARCR